MIGKVKRQFWIVILIISSGILSCDKELDLHVDFEGERLAISCLLNPHDSVRVYIETTNNPLQTIERSYSATESPSRFPEGTERITNANVELLENGKLIAKCVYDSLFEAFGHHYIPKEGYEYQLMVVVPGFEQVVSEIVRIPDRTPLKFEKSEPVAYVKIDSIITGNGIRTEVKEVQEFSFFISLDDPETERNYYGVRQILDFESNYFGVAHVRGRFMGFEDNECEYTHGAGLMRGFYFDDTCFNQEEDTFQYDFSFWKTEEFSGVINHQMNVYTFDESAYNYITFLGNYNNARGTSGLNKLPIRVPSSFENAYGVFGAYNYTVSTLLFE